MATRQDVEALLRNIPISTPAEVSQAETTMQMFLAVLNGAIEGGGSNFRVMNPIADARNLVDQMTSGNYGDAAGTLIGITGSAADVIVLLTGAIGTGGTAGMGTVATAGVVAEMVGAAAGPLAIAAAVVVATYRLPGDVNDNQRKLFFITDASGILTSWMFGVPHISPHSVLLQRARTGGYPRLDVSDACRSAHQKVHELWQRSYRNNTAARRAARSAARDRWQAFWLQMGTALSARLRPAPSVAGTAWVNSAITAAERRIRDAERDARRQQEAARRRQAAGGYWFRTPEGLELFMPD